MENHVHIISDLIQSMEELGHINDECQGGGQNIQNKTHILKFYERMIQYDKSADCNAEEHFYSSQLSGVLN